MPLLLVAGLVGGRDGAVDPPPLVRVKAHRDLCILGTYVRINRRRDQSSAGRSKSIGAEKEMNTNETLIRLHTVER